VWTLRRRQDKWLSRSTSNAHVPPFEGERQTKTDESGGLPPKFCLVNEVSRSWESQRQDDRGASNESSTFKAEILFV
jgi:hypothetical protein